MRLKAMLVAGMTAMVLGLGTPAFAGITNFGFETGDFSGWALNLNGGSGSVVTSWNGDQGTSYGPKEGTYFALLGSGSANVYQTLSQSFAASQGDALTGWAAFDYRDYHSYNDDAYVRILDASGAVVATPWALSGGSVPNYYDGAWTAWNWNAPASGTYTLQYGVRNYGDSGLSSVALFDAKGASSPVVPEPATGLLFMTGLAAAWRARRKNS